MGSAHEPALRRAGQMMYYHGPDSYNNNRKKNHIFKGQFLHEDSFISSCVRLDARDTVN